MKSIAAFFAGALIAIGPLKAMTIDFTFMRSHKCSSTSPALKIQNVPPGTTEISIKMTDLDLRSYDHGGGYIENKGGIAEVVDLPEGALQNYRGPCPRTSRPLDTIMNFPQKLMVRIESCWERRRNQPRSHRKRCRSS